MATQVVIPYSDEEKLIMAKIAFRQTQLGGRGDAIPQHELEDAKYYVDMALTTIKARNSFDPQQYARDMGQQVIIEFVRSMLLGTQPFLNPNVLSIYDAWLKAAAQERYSGRPDSWPEFPTISQRLRTHSFKQFNPDDQDETDF